MTTIPQEISAAILKVIKTAPTLVKADENKHARYNYVSIDGYYEVIPGLAVAHGLSWVPREVEAHPIGEKSVCLTYAFDVFHDGGAYVRDFSRFSVVHPVQGAQTAGSAMAYAEKMFMRSTFKVVTGEGDADATNPNDVRQAAPAKREDRKEERKPMERDYEANPPSREEVKEHVSEMQDGLPVFKAPISPEGWYMLRMFFVEFAKYCKTVGEVNRLVSINRDIVDEMEKASPEDYALVRRVIRDRRNHIEGKK